MAGLGQAVELAMSCEEIEKVGSHCTLANRGGAPGGAGANAAQLP